MAAEILSGTVTPTGNFTLYTNNTGQNVRLIIHHLFVHGGSFSNTPYSTRRVNITGGSHGTLRLPSSQIFENRNPQIVQRIKLGIGKEIAVEDQINNADAPTAATQNIIQNGCVRTILLENGVFSAASGPQTFPTEIVMRPNQQMVFEASSSTSVQFISFNITAMPEGG